VTSDDAPSARAGDEPSTDDLLDLAVAGLGGGRREGQHGMAVAVDEAVDAGRHLLVQAGTGTGKSLAYLVPAVRHAVVDRRRVVVSTATLALQRQVVTRDLPLVADTVGPRLPRPPRVALLKGWHNYLCKHKISGGYPSEGATLFDLPADPGPGEGAAAEQHPAPDAAAGAGRRGGGGGARLADQVRRLHAWADETDTGDRDDLVPGVPDRAWRQVSVTALECLGNRCPLLAECFPERARAAAREADVVVTNHAMLGIAASGNTGVLPEHDVVVVDEAHELAERVTASATVDLSLPVVEHAARLARRLPQPVRQGGSAAIGSVGMQPQILFSAECGQLRQRVGDAGEAPVAGPDGPPGGSDPLTIPLRLPFAVMLRRRPMPDHLRPPYDRGRHAHGTRGHGRSHVMPAYVAPQTTVPVFSGRLGLGTWQSIAVVDLNVDNPDRTVRLSFLPSG
jgi:Rad3-related DNA helicase